MEKHIRLFLEDGTKTIDIFAFEYNAQRMGGAPTITMSIMDFNVLDITSRCWCQFVDKNGDLVDEKFFVRNAPSSSKSSSDARYKYDITLVSEREALDNVYFIDVSQSSHEADVIVSKGAEFQFGGTISDYVAKLNAALNLSQLNGYSVVIDDSVKTQDLAKLDKFFRISRLSFTGALQEIYNQFDIPYYFIGKTCHVGYYNDNHYDGIVRYGSSDALIQVSRNSANNKIVTRCSGVGSSDNLPLYYPNTTTTGSHEILEYTGGLSEQSIKRIDYDRISQLTNLRDGATMSFYRKSEVADKIYDYKIQYSEARGTSTSSTAGSRQPSGSGTSSSRPPSGSTSTGGASRPSSSSSDRGVINGNSGSLTATITELNPLPDASNFYTEILFTFYAQEGIPVDFSCNVELGGYVPNASTTGAKKVRSTSILSVKLNDVERSDKSLAFIYTPTTTGEQSVRIKYSITLSEPLYEVEISSNGGYSKPRVSGRSIDIKATFWVVTNVVMSDYAIFDGSDVQNPLDTCGVVFNDGVTFENGASIVISETSAWMHPQPYLMPSIYRATAGAERFYNAVNGGYYYGDYYVSMASNAFANEYDQDRFCEHIESFDDIKPTIKGATHRETKLRMDMFTAFDYDDGDDDSVAPDGENFKHPYFYAKLRKLDFNLFEQALEEDEMTISFTSGQCAQCTFTIMVDEDTKSNTLQVKEDGSGVLKHETGDDKGKAMFAKGRGTDAQNDTKNNEVWIALKKDNNTYGELRPNAVFYPKPAEGNNDGDTFVITNIRMPQSYIENAEKELENRIIEYMIQNNLTGFSFDIKFSRIFLEENKSNFTDKLCESSRLNLEFQGNQYILYVNSFRYKIAQNDELPEISVTISDSIKVSKSGLSTLVSSVKSEVLDAVKSIDVMPIISRYALRKDQDDSTLFNLATGGLKVNRDSQVGGRLNVGKDANIGGNVEISGATSLARGLTLGNFTPVIGSIHGAQITEEGDASFKSIRANYLEVMSLLYNQIKASSAYTVFDDTGTIVDLSVDENGIYTLTFDENELTVKNEDGVGVQQFVINDIIHGFVNRLHNYEYSQMGACWMRVVEVPDVDSELESYQIKAVMYDDELVPAAPNLSPTVNMTLVHRGNETNKDRQSTFYISSKDGNIIQLMGVDSPKLYNIQADEYSNYGVVMGQLPEDLLKYVQQSFPEVKSYDPVLFAKYGVFENFLQVDYKGRPIKTANFRGFWSADTAKSDPYKVTKTTYDTVTHNGSLWKCEVPDTTIEPSISTSHWAQIVSKGDDSAVVSYGLNPSVNVIYFETKKSKLSVDKIDVSVVENTAVGYNVIQDQQILDNRGLSVWYSIDGKEPLVEFNISPAAAIELEDGNGILVSENDYGLWLEGNEFLAENIKDNITIYLKTDDGLTLALVVIPVIKAGSFKSTVFSRDMAIFDKGYTIQGGTYAEPFPMKDGARDPLWSDGIPDGTGAIYSSFNTFYGDGTSDSWSEPTLMADNADFEVLYSDVDFVSTSEARFAIPEGFSKDGIKIHDQWLGQANANGWYDEADELEDPIWMATNSRKQGTDWSDVGWIVTRIKGEHIGNNLIENSNFVNFIDGVPEKWSLVVSSMTANLVISGTKEGQNILRIHGGSGQIRSSRFLMEANTVYTFSMYVYAASSDDKCVSITVPKKSTYVTENATFVSEGEGTKAKTASFSANRANEWLKIVIHVKTLEESHDTCAVLLGGTDEDTLCCMPKMERGSVATTYTQAQSDLVGPVGDAGPMLYSAGEWVSNKLYEKDSSIVPFVYYDPNPNDNNDGKYYILKVDRVQSTKSPADDTQNWRSMTEYEAIFVKFLMARWARFGSNDGAVFYDKYLFSQKGKVGGIDAIYSDHKNNMFDSNGNFQEGSTTAFVPNVYIDFLNGKVYANDAVIRGHIEATSGTFSGTLSVAQGSAVINSDGNCRFSNGNVTFNADGSGSLGKNVMIWSSNGTTMTKNQAQTLWVDVSSTFENWFTSMGQVSGSSGTSTYYRIPVEKGSHFLLRAWGEAFLVLTSISNIEDVEGYLFVDVFKVVLRHERYTRTSAMPDQLIATNSFPIYTKRIGDDGIEYWTKYTNNIIAFPPNVSVEITYRYNTLNGEYGWVIDENDCSVYDL